MKGKMKTLYGLYKKYGRDAFLEASKFYTGKSFDTVEATLSDMESRWYDSKRMITLADKMLEDYNRGKCVLNQIDQTPGDINETFEQVLSM